MTRYTEGPFRVLAGRHDDEWLLLDVNSADPVYVPRSSLPDAVAGNRINGDLQWDGDVPTLSDATVETETRFRFRRTDEPIFEAAQTCFETARAGNEAMNSRVTYDTDRNPNGIVYTFAEQPGRRDLFTEFRDGTKPLDPLCARAAEGTDPPFSVWVLDSDEPFVVVYLVLDPDGLLERTMRDTYE
ncbi:DUF6663 family protein [Natronomonas sp. LN261]|jgi:hypothetical protein|uniref:DUF6663 family protein n=1 Tax=Natronomonas sp. LN261 TaxID=2750669 RepID=UPI0015EF915C|nr:DUF6663 family protein [Natronomonas sp. LN261]